MLCVEDKIVWKSGRNQRFLSLVNLLWLKSTTLFKLIIYLLYRPGVGRHPENRNGERPKGKKMDAGHRREAGFSRPILGSCRYMQGEYIRTFFEDQGKGKGGKERFGPVSMEFQLGWFKEERSLGKVFCWVHHRPSGRGLRPFIVYALYHTS